MKLHEIASCIFFDLFRFCKIRHSPHTDSSGSFLHQILVNFDLSVKNYQRVIQMLFSAWSQSLAVILCSLNCCSNSFSVKYLNLKLGLSKIYSKLVFLFVCLIVRRSISMKSSNMQRSFRWIPLSRNTTYRGEVWFHDWIAPGIGFARSRSFQENHSHWITIHNFWPVYRKRNMFWKKIIMVRIRRISFVRFLLTIKALKKGIFRRMVFKCVQQPRR